MLARVGRGAGCRGRGAQKKFAPGGGAGRNQNGGGAEFDKIILLDIEP
jgi:hypothetical protein